MTIIKHIVERHRLFLPFVILFPLLPALFKTLVASFGDISSYYQLYYFIGYQYGFGGRKLLGTIFSHMLPYHVGHKQILPIIWSINAIFLILLISFISNGLKHSINQNIGLSLFFVYAMWFVSPFSISSYFSQGVNLMYPEIWSMTLVLVFLFIHRYYRDKWWYYLSSIVICLICCLIHHIFCCLFFPLVFSLFINDLFGVEANRKELAKKTFAYGFISLLLLIVFVAIWKFSTMNTDLNTLYEAIIRRTAPDVCSHDKEAIEQMYFISNIDNTINQSTNFHRRTIELVLTIIALAPLIFILIYPWILTIKASTSKSTRYKYLLVALIPTVLHIPIYFFAVDYGRWEYAWFFNYICLLVFFVWNNDSGIVDAFNKICNKMKNNPIVLISAFLYLAALPASTAWYIPEIHKFADILIR